MGKAGDCTNSLAARLQAMQNPAAGAACPAAGLMQPLGTCVRWRALSKSLLQVVCSALAVPGGSATGPSQLVALAAVEYRLRDGTHAAGRCCERAWLQGESRIRPGPCQAVTTKWFMISLQGMSGMDILSHSSPFNSQNRAPRGNRRSQLRCSRRAWSAEPGLRSQGPR